MIEDFNDDLYLGGGKGYGRRRSTLGFHVRGRPSMLYNEDDFDYAIELHPDDEYRQAAEALPEIVDFDEVELINDEDLMSYHMSSNDLTVADEENKDDAEKVKNEEDEDTESTPLQSQQRQHQHQRWNDDAYPDHIDLLDKSLVADTTQSIPLSYNDNPSPINGLRRYSQLALRTRGSQQYDDMATGIGPMSSTNHRHSSFGVIPKREFVSRMQMLSEQRRWVEKAARRSSLGFGRQFHSTDKEAMDRFLIAMSQGVHIRRHQSHKSAELVRLFSSTGCQEIEWEPPKAVDLHRQRLRENGLDTNNSSSTTTTTNTPVGTSAYASSNYDRSMVDFFIAVCGCGDDLDQRPALNIDGQPLSGKAQEHSSSLFSLHRLFRNFGYRRRGHFEDTSILAVHPASREDPTAPGYYGTQTLRDSKDTFNEQLTFSVVMLSESFHPHASTTSSSLWKSTRRKRESSSQNASLDEDEDDDRGGSDHGDGDDQQGGGVSTLDIECSTLETYVCLLRGFKMLQEEAEETRRLQDDLEAATESAAHNGNPQAKQSKNTRAMGKEEGDDSQLTGLTALWRSLAASVRESNRHRDPVADLYAPSLTIDPFRALRVGGGLGISQHIQTTLASNSSNNNTANATNGNSLKSSPGNSSKKVTASQRSRSVNNSPMSMKSMKSNRSGRSPRVGDSPTRTTSVSGIANKNVAKSIHTCVPSTERDASLSQTMMRSASLAVNNKPFTPTQSPINSISRATTVATNDKPSEVEMGRLSPKSTRPLPSVPSTTMPRALPLPIAQFLGWKSAGTQIWARLKMAGLDVKCVLSWDLSRVILKIRCPQWRLEQMAEQMHLKIKTKDGTLKPFRVARRDTFAINSMHSTNNMLFALNGTLTAATSASTNRSIFRSSERQQIIDFILRSKIKDGGAELDEHTELGKFILQRFPLHMYSRLIDIRHSWITFWKREPAGVMAEPFSVFSASYRDSFDFVSQAVRYFLANLLTQPLDSIAEYFGETIAFYFAFMAFYTRWLVFPSILGVIVFAIQYSTHQLDHWICVPYAIVLMLWISFLLAFWRQKSAALAYKWGVLDYEVEETERPQFQGKYVFDEFTGELRKSYPLFKRFLRYCVSIPIMIASMCVMLCVMTVTFYTQDRVYSQYVHKAPLDLTPKFPLVSSSSSSSSSSRSSEAAINSQQQSSPFHSMRSLAADTNFPQVAVPAWMHLDSTSSPVLEHIPVLPITSAEALSTLPMSNTHAVSFTETQVLELPMPSAMPTPLPSTSASWNRQIAFSEWLSGDFWTATFLYPCLYGIIVNMLTILFNSLAIWLNEFENHRTQTAFLNRLILKVFSFQFVTIFTSLYYYAFFSHDVESGFTRIAVTIFSLMTVGQWWQVFLDIAMPAFYHRLLMFRLRANFAKTNRKIFTVRELAERNKQLADAQGLTSESQIEIQEKLEKRIRLLNQAKSQCWEEALQARYNNFSDYTAMVIQLSFILCFSPIFPLAPLIALCNNLLLIRFKAVKVCYTRQRPIAQKCGSIGVWNDVLQILSVCGALTNCAVLGFVSRPLRDNLTPYIGETGLALVLFAFEQLLLLFKYWLHVSLPSVPPSVARAQLRERKSFLSKKEQEKKEQEQRAKVERERLWKENERARALEKKRQPRAPVDSALTPASHRDKEGGSGTGSPLFSSHKHKKQSSLLFQYVRDILYSPSQAHSAHNGIANPGVGSIHSSATPQSTVRSVQRSERSPVVSQNRQCPVVFDEEDSCYDDEDEDAAMLLNVVPLQSSHQPHSVHGHAPLAASQKATFPRWEAIQQLADGYGCDVSVGDEADNYSTEEHDLESPYRLPDNEDEDDDNSAVNAYFMRPPSHDEDEDVYYDEIDADGDNEEYLAPPDHEPWELEDPYYDVASAEEPSQFITDYSFAPRASECVRSHSPIIRTASPSPVRPSQSQSQSHKQSLSPPRGTPTSQVVLPRPQHVQNKPSTLQQRERPPADYRPPVRSKSAKPLSTSRSVRAVPSPAQPSSAALRFPKLSPTKSMSRMPAKGPHSQQLAMQQQISALEAEKEALRQQLVAQSIALEHERELEHKRELIREQKRNAMPNTAQSPFAFANGTSSSPIPSARQSPLRTGRRDISPSKPLYEQENSALLSNSPLSSPKRQLPFAEQATPQLYRSPPRVKNTADVVQLARSPLREKEREREVRTPSRLSLSMSPQALTHRQQAIANQRRLSTQKPSQMSNAAVLSPSHGHAHGLGQAHNPFSFANSHPERIDFD